MVLAIAGRAVGTSLVPKLLTPGVLQALLLLSVLAAAELLLNDTFFRCPCGHGLAVVYGLAFLFVPGVALFLADFPWKLLVEVKSAGPGLVLSMARRPLFFFFIWIVLALMDHRHVDCVAYGTRLRSSSCTEVGHYASAVLQLLALLLWLLLLLVAVVLTVCRRRIGCSKRTRSRLVEVVTQLELEQAKSVAAVVNKIGSKEIHPILTREELLTLEPGLSDWTLSTLDDLGLTSERVLACLVEEDLQELRLPLAQRALLRSLVARLKRQTKGGHSDSHEAE